MHKQKWELRFGECEHYGDLDMYAGVVMRCGGKVYGQELEPEEYEEGLVFVETAETGEMREILRKLRETDKGGFLDGCQRVA